MEKVYEVTLKRMVDGKPESWLVDTLASNSIHAKIKASAKMRRKLGITNCTWTVTRCRVVAKAAPRALRSLSWEKHNVLR